MVSVQEHYLFCFFLKVHIPMKFIQSLTGVSTWGPVHVLTLICLHPFAYANKANTSSPFLSG